MAEKKKIILKLKLPKINGRRLVKGLLIVLVLLISLALGGIFGAYLTIKDNVPSVDEVAELKPLIISTVYSDEGVPAKEFAAERRIQVPYSQIPLVLKQAIIATEDPRFFAHKGIDYRGIMRALKEDVFRIVLRNKKLHGGSTITQQLARSLFLYPQQTIRRKLKEMFLAVELERKFSKEKIFELYCNQFYLGHGAWGVEAASQLYFGKSVNELTLPEAALIAGIFRGPGVYSPYNNQEVTLNRRNHVINRMVEEGFISKEAAKAVAERTNSHLARVYGVMSFYHFFKTKKPGKNRISVCLGTACYLKGGQDLIDEAKTILGLGEDEISTEDGLFSVEPVRCIGCCGLAPVLSVNGDVYGKLTKDQIAGILTKYKNA